MRWLNGFFSLLTRHRASQDSTRAEAELLIDGTKDGDFPFCVILRAVRRRRGCAILQTSLSPVTMWMIGMMVSIRFPEYSRNTL